MDWRDELEQTYINGGFDKDYDGSFRINYVENWIESHIIEKLIADIPDDIDFSEHIKQQLRDKWL